MKFFTDTTIKMRSFRMRLLSYAVAALVLTFIHLVLIEFIAIDDVSPDLLVILCVWIALTEGQFTALFAAFAIGLFYDIVSMDVIGVSALAKTVAVFFAGFFFVEEKSDQIIKSYKFLLILFGASLINNIIYYVFHIKLSDSRLYMFFLRFGLGGALYTTFFGIFAILLKIPRRKIKMIE